MIYITGDCHADFRRFEKRRFREQEGMTKDDYVLICGDFGGVWYGDDGERKRLQELSDRSFTTLFVDGNHENFDLLYKYPVVDFHGGKAHRIMPHIYHLMRGEVFELEGMSFFAFGGASSRDIQDGILDRAAFVSDEAFRRECHAMNRAGKLYRVIHESWWPEELPSASEMENGIRNLEKHGGKVDYVITHCLPTSIQARFSEGLYKPNMLTDYLDLIERSAEYKRWYCGHYHINERILDKVEILYEGIAKIH